MHNTTVSKVKKIMIEQPLKVSNRELHLHNRKTVAEIKEMEWNSETKVSITINRFKLNVIYEYQIVLLKINNLYIAGNICELQSQNHKCRKQIWMVLYCMYYMQDQG